MNAVKCISFGDTGLKTRSLQKSESENSTKKKKMEKILLTPSNCPKCLKNLVSSFVFPFLCTSKNRLLVDGETLFNCKHLDFDVVQCVVMVI